MVNKLNNKWWVFTIFSLFFAYLNPYFVLFSMVMVVVLFFDCIMFIVLRGHYKIVKRKLSDKKENREIVKKLFHKELLMFKVGKIFTTIFVVYVVITMTIENLSVQTLLEPIYIPIIQKSFILQVFCIMLSIASIASIAFSCVLFWFYTNLYKEKLN